jgi:hypothetical protein
VKVRAVALLSVMLLLSVPLTACGSSSGDDSSGDSGGSGLSDTIVLPDGWEMLDAVSVADVESVVGVSGYEPWSETLSDAAAGKPQGGYVGPDGLVASKINILVYTKDGQAEYDRVAGYVNNPTPLSGDLWDEAIIGDMSDAGEDLAAVLARRGDVCLRVRWNPEEYANWDRTELGVALTTMVIENLYGT